MKAAAAPRTKAEPAPPAAFEVPPPPGKDPFDIDEVFRLLREATASLPKAAMFDLRDRGYGSPFEQLVSALVSARTPEAMAALPEEEIVRLLHGATFPELKARDIRTLSASIAAAGGAVPDTAEGLTALRGVGPKIAALTLGVGFGKPAVSVDIHVHRIANRWGYVAAGTPERTMQALARVLPERYWIEINERLVPFGKSVCTGERPRCGSCPLLRQCRQVGVPAPRAGA